MGKEPVVQKRRWLRLSLRTLFVLVTVLCLLLGWKSNVAVQQRDAVQIIREAGGGFTYDYQQGNSTRLANNPPGPPWLRNKLGIDFFANVIQVDCHDLAFEDIAAIGKLSQLQRLNLNATRVSTLSPLANLTRLQVLECRETNIVDITPLRRCGELQFLQLNGTRVRDLRPVSRLARLEELYLRDTFVDDIAPLANLKSLEFLGLRGTRVSNVSPLRNLTSLKWLDLRNTSAAIHELQALQRALPDCNIEIDQVDTH